jgi:hypothetical protein
MEREYEMWYLNENNESASSNEDAKVLSKYCYYNNIHLPEYSLPFIIHLLAHHPNYKESLGIVSNSENSNFLNSPSKNKINQSIMDIRAVLVSYLNGVKESLNVFFPLQQEMERRLSIMVRNDRNKDLLQFLSNNGETNVQYLEKVNGKLLYDISSAIKLSIDTFCVNNFVNNTISNGDFCERKFVNKLNFFETN